MKGARCTVRAPTRHVQRLVAHAGQVSRAGGLDDPIELVNGAVTSGPSLAVNSDGMKMPNPFVIGSGPPGALRLALWRPGSYDCESIPIGLYDMCMLQHWARGRTSWPTQGDELDPLVPSGLSDHQKHRSTGVTRYAGTNYTVMKKAFDEGWGGVICKTLSLDSSKVKNVTPRYARLLSGDGQVIGWENIELISDRPFETMLDDLKRLKEEYPDRCAPGRPDWLTPVPGKGRV